MQDLEALLRVCCVQVMDGTRFCGSGFVVGADVVLTCAHVVSRAQNGIRVRLGTTSIAVIAMEAFPPHPSTGSGPYPLPDLALLHLAEGTAVAGARAGAGVWLGKARPAAGVQLLGAGFSADPPTGTVSTDTILVTTVGSAGEGFIKIKDDRVPAGMSGSPLLDLTTGRVCGILKASRDYAASEGGWIVPVSVITTYLPEVVAANVAAHCPGSPWWDVATDRRGFTQGLFGGTDTLAKPIPPRNPRPSWWLEPRHQVVEFHPRPQLAELHSWCRSETDTPVRLILAAGGMGKTRLGLQLCRDLAAEGWISGIVRSGASLEAFTGEPLRRAIATGHRVLIVLDYAETFAPDLPDLVEAIVTLPPNRVRVLMLARSTGRWWEQVTEHATGGHLVDPEPVRLTNLGDGDAEDRQSILAAAVQSFRAAIHGDPGPDPDTAKTVPSAWRTLAATDQTVLSLHAAALNHVLDESHRKVAGHEGSAPQGAARRRSANPLRGTLAHERRYWLQVAAQSGIPLAPGDPLVDQILIIPTLYPARDLDEAATAVGRIDAVRARLPGRESDLAQSLAMVYPNTNPEQPRVWDPLQPDRLGETLLLDTLADQTSNTRAAENVENILDGSDLTQAMHALTVLVRAASAAEYTGHDTETAVVQSRARAVIKHLVHQHSEIFLPAGVDVAVTLPNPNSFVAILAAAVAAANAAALHAARARLPEFHLDFNDLAAAVAEALVARLYTADDIAANRSESRLHRLASALDDLGGRLHAVGRREDALAPTEKAVRIHRELAAANPATYRPDLAAALNNLGYRLDAVGRREDALAQTEEAAQLYRELAAADPVAYRPGLATTLNNLGNALSGVGRREDALALTEEATQLYRELAAVNPAAHRPDLAIALNNLGVRLDAVGRREDALVPTEEAAQLYRELAAVNPAAYRPGFAGALDNLGNQLDAVGRREDALSLVQEAAELYRELAAANPAAHRPDFAGALNNLGLRLDAVGRREDALAPAQEAAQLYRELAAANPAAYRRGLANALNNLGGRLRAMGRREDALAPTEEAAQLYRELAAVNPAAYRPGLANALNNLGVRLEAVGRREDALAPTEEAAQLYRELAAANPAAYRPGLANALNNLGVRLEAVGRREDALAPTEEAAQLYRELAAANPVTYRPGLATVLNNLGGRLEAVGRHQDALAPTEEAAQLYRELAAANPATYRPTLAATLNNLGVRLEAVGRREDALAPTEEAAQLYRELAAANPATYRPDLALALNNLGVRLEGLGRHQDALAPTEEAAQLYRELAVANPVTYRPGLATVLNNLGGRLEAVGRHQDALAPTEEAAQLYRELAAANPATYRPTLAATLNNLGVRLEAVGRREDALAPTEEAAQLYRELAVANPVTYRPGLATVLNNLGGRLEAVGRREDALSLMQEAAQLYRELAAANPATYRPDLAAGLNNVGVRLEAVGRREDALSLCRKPSSFTGS